MKTILCLVVLVIASALALGQRPTKKPEQEKPVGEKTALSSSAEPAVRQLVSELAEATARNDTAALERNYADDYTFTNPSGVVLTKAQRIAATKSGDLKFESFSNDEVNVRVYGDVAVVTGRSTLKGQLKGQDISGQYRFTSVYVNQGGRWQAVASQSTRIATQQ